MMTRMHLHPVSQSLFLMIANILTTVHRHPHKYTLPSRYVFMFVFICVCRPTFQEIVKELHYLRSAVPGPTPPIHLADRETSLAQQARKEKKYTILFVKACCTTLKLHAIKGKPWKHVLEYKAPLERLLRIEACLPIQIPDCVVHVYLSACGHICCSSSCLCIMFLCSTLLTRSWSC